MAQPSYSYAHQGPPFDFLGNLSKTQWDSFRSWLAANADLPDVTQKFHQARALQLRKAGGMLEQYYATTYHEQLAPTFRKASWQPGQQGWFPYRVRNDYESGVAMWEIKRRLRSALSAQDEAVFQMNRIRVLIEREEDTAQMASEASSDLATIQAKIDGLFTVPGYEATLVMNQTNTYLNMPRWRVNQLDAPTAWETALQSRSIKQQ